MSNRLFICHPNTNMTDILLYIYLYCKKHLAILIENADKTMIFTLRLA